MEFDKSRAYTALNADELKVGSEVIVADDISHLKDFVKDEVVCTLEHVTAESQGYRFVANKGIHYLLAYLVAEPEEKKLKWVDLVVGDVLQSKYKDGYRFAMVSRVDTYSETDRHICIGDEWLSDVKLIEWEKVEE